MAYINSDLDKVRDCGNRFIHLTKQYNSLVDQLYQRINNMKTKTFEWVGTDADVYIANVNASKGEFEKLALALSEYGQLLINVSDDLESKIKSNYVS